MKYYLAIDIGASSGRHILSHLENGKIHYEEIYRFDNISKTINHQLCWDAEAQINHIIAGIKKCGEIGKIPASIGIDTWGVDFVLLDEKDDVIGNLVAYRDSRTNGMDNILNQILPETELYSRTGIQKQPFNTIYQLLALREQQPEDWEKAQTILFTPEYFNFILTNVKKTEYSIASTSGLLDAAKKDWDMELIEKMGLPSRVFSREICLPGAVVGSLSEKIQKEVGFNSTVVLPPTHDTGSAFIAVPAKDDQAVYISSGTWSLLGIESKVPVTSEESRLANFTNEGGYGGIYRYLRNIMGLWMIQSVRQNLDKKYSFAELEQMAKQESDFPSRVDVNDLSFFAPESMIDAVKDYCRKTDQKIPDTIGQVMQCVYKSLAQSYAETITGLEKITGKKFTSINIVGGGTKDVYLNALTAEATGLPVYAGPTEGTALGNLLSQMISAGEIPDVPAARDVIRNSFEIKEYTP